MRSRRRCALKKFFLYRIALYEQKTPAFSQIKTLLFTQTFFIATKSNPFPPSASHFTPLNLLFAKNAAVLLLFALILCCKAGASHRFKSLPAIPGKVAAFRKTGYLMNAGHFRKNSRIDRRSESSPESRGSQTSGVLLVLFVHAKRINSFPSQGALRFCKPRISAQRQQKEP